MSCLTDKFVITKGVDNTFIFTIKQNDSTLPMEIDISDTFVATLINLDTGTTVLTTNLTIDDALSGRVEYLVTSAEVASLDAMKGARVDRFYLKPVYKLVIDCTTVANGNFTAKVQEIYVD